MTRSSIKSVAALGLALVLLGLTWALLVQAAPAHPPQADGDLVWVSVLVTPDANAPAPGVEPFFVGQVYRRAVGDLQRIAGHVRASDLPALASQPGVIHISNGSPPPTPPPPDLSYPDEPTASPRKEPPDT